MIAKITDPGTVVDEETSSEKGKKKCTDGIDNDGDGLIDEFDDDCGSKFQTGGTR